MIGFHYIIDVFIWINLEENIKKYLKLFSDFLIFFFLSFFFTSELWRKAPGAMHF